MTMMMHRAEGKNDGRIWKVTSTLEEEEEEGKVAGRGMWAP